MARFYAVFDPSTTAAIGNSPYFYEKRYIGANAGTSSQLSASAALLRDGLIASQSILSSEMYAQMDSSNEDGSKGIIIPYDVLTTNGANLEFSNVYTSSISGVVHPASSLTRPPDAFISASDPRLFATGDTGAILKSYYTNAGSAVTTLLTSKIQVAVGNTTNAGPFQRDACSGKTNQRNTSINYDYDFSYFAWDDFQPGDPTFNFTQQTGLIRSVNNDITFNFSTNFVSDRAGTLYIFQAEYSPTGSSLPIYKLKDTSNVNLEGQALDLSGGSLSFISRIFSGSMPAGGYKLTLTAYFRDATYTTCISPCTSSAAYGPNSCEYTSTNQFVQLLP
jgi:hypothetical protein